MLSFFTRKIILSISFILTILLVILFFGLPYSLCRDYFSLVFCGYYLDFFNFLAILFFVAPTMLFFSLISLKYKENFIVWRKFTFIYLFIYLFIVIITPWYSGDEFLHITKGFVGLVLVVLYSLISIGLLIFSKNK